MGCRPCVGLYIAFLVQLELSYVVAASSLTDVPTATKLDTLKPRSIGNDVARSDLYGIGVRVGFYLQSFAFVVSTFRSKTRGSFILAASILQCSFLACVTILVKNRTISPVETVILVQLIGFAFTPALIAMMGMNFSGNGLGLIIVIVSALWFSGFSTWFWVVGYRQLPLLDTSNVALFYVRVRLDEPWFRKLNLALSSISIWGMCILSILELKFWWWPSVGITL